MARHLTPDDDLVAALDSAEQGETIRLSKGYYTIDSPLHIDKDFITIHGEGINNTVIRQTENVPALKLEGGQRRGDRRKRWQLRDLTFQSRPGTTSDLIYARYGGTHRFENVRFDSAGSSGNSIYAEECWDIRFTNCEFSSGGDPTPETAAVYLYNGDYDMSNSFLFLNCTWEKITSYALYSDSSGSGNINDRIYISNCKFRGFGRGGRIKDDPNRHYIDGVWRGIKINNSHFNWSLGGFIRNQNEGEFLQVSNCSFQEYGGNAIEVQSTDSLIANSVFTSRREDGTAIHVAGEGTSVVSNRVVDDGGIRCESDGACIQNNTVRGAERDGINLNGDRCTVAGNAVSNAGCNGVSVRGDSNILTANTCIQPGGSGVELTDSRYCILTGNHIHSAGDRSIVSQGTSDFILAANNMGVENTNPGVSFVGDHNETTANLSY